MDGVVLGMCTDGVEKWQGRDAEDGRGRRQAQVVPQLIRQNAATMSG